MTAPNLEDVSLFKNEAFDDVLEIKAAKAGSNKSFRVIFMLVVYLSLQAGAFFVM